jgi:hypothetical protein
MAPNQDKGDRWRERAEEVRSIADQLTDPEARRVMLEIAAGYERLARRADLRNTNKKLK